jgi:TonB family protein
MTQEALAHDVHGRVVLEAVLCRTGRVTDLRVVESLPYGMTEKSIESVRQLKFTPAEMNWHTVSQKMRFEFYFNERGVDAGGGVVIVIEVHELPLISEVKFEGLKGLLSLSYSKPCRRRKLICDRAAFMIL